MALNESQYEIFDHGEGRASLVVSIPGESSESVMFLGHIDTVPCGDETAWKYSRFMQQKMVTVYMVLVHLI